MIEMEDILKPGAVLKAFELTIEEVREILKETEIKQAEVRKMKEIRPGDLERIVNL